MDQPFTFQWQSQHNDQQSEATFQYVDWTALIQIVQDLTHQKCHYEGPYHAGGRHIVRRIALDTGELWLARFPIIPRSVAVETKPVSAPSSTNAKKIGTWWTEEQRYMMEGEIATMKFIKGRTKIPVPVVFGHMTVLEGNPTRLPFMLMQCIKGNMLFDVGGLEVLTDKQKTKVREEIASIQCQMAGASLDKLGVLTLGPDGTFPVGPLPTSFGFSGPYTSSTDYFISWAENAQFGNIESLLQPHDDPAIQKLKQATISFPGLLKSTIVNQSSDRLSAFEGTYPIIHGDFLVHNLLFNEKYEVVGVFDWEGSHSAPLEVFAAVTNMFSHFDLKNLCVDFQENPQGLQYIEDVKTKEKNLRQESGLSEAFGSLLGDIGKCMSYFETGKMVLFGDLLDRYKEAQA